MFKVVQFSAIWLFDLLQSDTPWFTIYYYLFGMLFLLLRLWIKCYDVTLQMNLFTSAFTLYYMFLKISQMKFGRNLLLAKFGSERSLV